MDLGDIVQWGKRTSIKAAFRRIIPFILEDVKKDGGDVITIDFITQSIQHGVYDAGTVLKTESLGSYAELNEKFNGWTKSKNIPIKTNAKMLESLFSKLVIRVVGVDVIVYVESSSLGAQKFIYNNLNSDGRKQRNRKPRTGRFLRLGTGQ